MNQRDKLEQLAKSIPNLRTCTVRYVRGGGYYLEDSYGGKSKHNVAWFANFQIGWKWLKDYQQNGRGNFAILRVGRERFMEAE